jgi:hypothetical protein
MAWRLTWSSDLPNPTFRVYRDGVLVETTTVATTVISVSLGQTPHIEVSDDVTDVLDDAYPDHLILTWGRSATAASFRVDEHVDDDWVRRGTLTAEAGRTYYEFRTAKLADDTEHTFRIVPVSSVGVDGDAVEHVVLMVRRPDPPLLAATYDDDTATITVN